MSESWNMLTEELDHWHRAGRIATLWWRDDDAVAETDALNRLLDCAAGHPLALAVVPGHLEPSLVLRLAHEPLVQVLPHGLTHSNHEPPDRKKAEFGAARELGPALDEIRRAASLLQDAFQDQYQAIFVPPWNRITGDIAASLPGLGLSGVSTFTDRAAAPAVPCVNCHVDILDWRAKRQTGKAAYIGDKAALEILTGALNRRRVGTPGTDPTEPVGLMTHHLDHDTASWEFLGRLLPVLAAHPAVRWVTAAEGLS